MTISVSPFPRVMSDVLGVRDSFADGDGNSNHQESEDENALTIDLPQEQGMPATEEPAVCLSLPKDKLPISRKAMDDKSECRTEKSSKEPQENGTNGEVLPTLRLRNLVEIEASPPVPNEVIGELIVLSGDSDVDECEDTSTTNKNNQQSDKVTNKATDHSYTSSSRQVTIINKSQFVLTKRVSGDGMATFNKVDPMITECIQCNEVGSCCTSFTLDGTEEYFICSDKCINENKLLQKASLSRVSLSSLSVLTVAKLPQRLCSTCQNGVNQTGDTLSWETMDFCKEDCLKVYVDTLGKHCSQCRKICADPSLGKYSVRFGSDIRQFCQASCLEEFKKKLKVCSYCQEDITNASRYKAAINDKSFKDFCSRECVFNYDKIYSTLPIRLAAGNCAVCSKRRLVSLEVAIGDEQYKLCSEVCFSAFKFVHPIKMGFCDLCKKYYDLKVSPLLTFHDDALNLFCSRACFNVFITMKRKIVQCNWCKVKKYNFDMIKKIFSNKQVMMFCSFNCFTMWKLSPKRNTCDHCSYFGVIMYHLGMSDGTLRSFCGQDCLMKFQCQFNKTPVTPSEARPVDSNVVSVDQCGNTDAAITPITNITGIILNGTSVETTPDNSAKSANTASEPVVANIPLEVSSNAPAKLITLAPTTTMANSANKGPVPAVCQVVFAPPERPIMCNKMTMFVSKGPQMKSKSAMCLPITFTKSTQTDPVDEANVLVSSSESPSIVSTSKENDLPDNDSKVSTHSLDQTFVVCQGKREVSIDISGDESSSSKRQRLDSSDGVGSLGRQSGSGNNPGPAGGGGGGGAGGGGGDGDRPPTPSTPPTPPSPERKFLKREFGVNAWKRWAATADPPVDEDPFSVPSATLGPALARFIESLRQSSPPLPVDSIFYLCLGIQDYLYSLGRVVNIFFGPEFLPFVDLLDNLIKMSTPDPVVEIWGPRIEEEHLWESRQLGTSSPWTLLSTLIFFNTKYFHIDSVDGHKSLCMSHIMKYWKRTGNDATRTKRLLYYPPNNTSLNHSSLSSVNDDSHTAEENKKAPLQQIEDPSNPWRCPVTLYEFYLSKCSDSVKGRGDAIYLVPEVNVSPSSPTWYTTEPLPAKTISMILNRLSLVKETYLILH